MGSVAVVRYPSPTAATSLTVAPKISLSSTFLSLSSKRSNYSNPLFFSRNPNSMRNPNYLSSSSSTTSTLQVYATSTISASNEELETTSSCLVGKKDLLIVGPGVLGRLVAQKWHEEHPGCQIYGQTRTQDHHDELIQMGINPSLKGTKLARGFPYVIFCAPPSRSPDYPGDVREAALNWNGEGSFVFTSSSAPYDCDDNGFCDENTPIVPIGRSPRTDVLIKAEKVVLDCGGCVLRLAGLYKADRGAHTYWLEKGTVEVCPDRMVNLIHYEDAASLAIAILKMDLRASVLLGCDNHPLSRQEVMDLVNKSGKFSKKFLGFTGIGGPLGKRLNNSKTREKIGWEPKYPSFGRFLETL